MNIKVKIRNNIFETNSSSTHSFVSTMKEGKTILNKVIKEYIEECLLDFKDSNLNDNYYNEKTIYLRNNSISLSDSNECYLGIKIIYTLQSKIDFLINSILCFYNNGKIPDQIKWISRILKREGYKVVIELTNDDYKGFYDDGIESLNTLNLDDDIIEDLKAFTLRVKRLIKKDNYIISKDVPYKGNFDINIEVV
jgi:hypothetical protein|nr:MAG TPA: hypothetical protein [Crassvirales sp.]